MSEYLGEHWVVTVLITILLGAIGSGIWDTAIKPYGSRLSNTIYSIITLNATKSRDRIYENAAMGHHEFPCLYILLFLFSMLIGIVIIIQVGWWSIDIGTIDSIELSNNYSGTNGKQLKQSGSNELTHWVPTAGRFTAIYLIFASLFIFRRFYAINRMNLINTYFEQSLRAVRPNAEIKSILLLEQRFALMTCRDDFETIVADLEQIASDQGIVLPERYV